MGDFLSKTLRNRSLVMLLLPVPNYLWLEIKTKRTWSMASVYEEVEIEDMDFVEEEKTFYYMCPCGDRFFITVVRALGDENRHAPSCPVAVWYRCRLALGIP